MTPGVRLGEPRAQEAAGQSGVLARKPTKNVPEGRGERKGRRGQGPSGRSAGPELTRDGGGILGKEKGEKKNFLNCGKETNKQTHNTKFPIFTILKCATRLCSQHASGPFVLLQLVYLAHCNVLGVVLQHRTGFPPFVNPENIPLCV